MIRLATRQRRQYSEWTRGYGIHESSDFIGKPFMLPFYCTTHDCYDRISLPIHPRWALVRPCASSRGQDARCLQMMQHCGLNQMVNRVASLGSRPIGMCSQVLVYRPMLSRVVEHEVVGSHG
jgi:hypothetical protein